MELYENLAITGDRAWESSVADGAAEWQATAAAAPFFPRAWGYKVVHV